MKRGDMSEIRRIETNICNYPNNLHTYKTLNTCKHAVIQFNGSCQKIIVRAVDNDAYHYMNISKHDLTTHHNHQGQTTPMSDTRKNLVKW